MEDMVLTPQQIVEKMADVGKEKAQGSLVKLLLLGFMAGAFIAFASEGSNMAAFNLLANPNTFGLGKALAGAIFGTGLMLVVIAGGELFTGNCLMIVGVLKNKITFKQMLRNWVIVYIGNFIGSMFIAVLMTYSGLFNSSDGLLGAMTIKIASSKVQLGFIQAICLGILCNMLVCLAVWMASATKSMVGKLFAIFFPIWLFITSGFEHSIANMYYIPAGILIKNQSLYTQLLPKLNVGIDALANLDWGHFLMNNLLPVTIGNIIGGVIFVGVIYFMAYQSPTNDTK